MAACQTLTGKMFCLIGLFMAPGVVPAQETLDSLVDPMAKVMKLAGGFTFTEGPAARTDGSIVFSDIPNQRIYQWSTDRGLQILREESGGANGLFFDRAGNLLACEGDLRRLTRMTPKGKLTVLADSYDGRKLNSPNDLWIHPDGGVYFTDPRYGSQDDLQQGGFHVYYLPSEGGKLRRVIGDLVKPNGIVGHSDGKRLYVADPGAGKIYVYTIGARGELSGRRSIASQGSDGMTLDERGNLYLTSGGVQVYSPVGEKIGEIKIPEGAANVCFGGPEYQTLFITARTSLYALKMKLRGQR